MTRSDNDDDTEPRRDVLTVVIVAIIAMMLGVNLFMMVDDSDGELTGATAPEIELPVMERDGETVALEDHQGRVVLVDFWATWCPPCREQMPTLEAIADDPALADDVEVLSVNTDPRTDDRHRRIREFMDEEHLSMPTLLDDGRAQKAFGVATLPTLAVVDPQGQVVYVGEGVHDETDIRELIQKAAD